MMLSAPPTGRAPDPNALIDLVQITGHLHVGGISFDLYNDATGELLCHSVPTYGETHAAGDEKGYGQEIRLRGSALKTLQATRHKCSSWDLISSEL